MTAVVNILVVDDEEIMRSLFTDILQDEGFKVTAVVNGREGLDKMKEISFGAVFLDVHMPVMNGLETLKAIKEISPELPVVMMDSYPDRLLTESLNEGAVSCIQKPFVIKELKNIINKILKLE